MAGNSVDPGRSVTSKVVAILLTFTNGSLYSLTELAKLTGLPISTVHRLATELAAWKLKEVTSREMIYVSAANGHTRVEYRNQ